MLFMPNLIKCPNCGHEFAVEEAYFSQAEEKIRKEILEEVESDKIKTIKEAEARGKEKAEEELRILREENEKNKQENLALKRKELELLKKEKEINEQEETLRLKNG